MPIDAAELHSLDAQGLTILNAIAPAGGGLNPTSTLTKSVPFVCSDGKAYWVKKDAQHGLGAELIAGRLAALLSAGPTCQIINLPQQAIPEGVQASHLVGTVFGSEGIPNAQNSKDLARFLNSGPITLDRIDARSRALTIAFQSWVGVGDQQVLGRVCKL